MNMRIWKYPLEAEDDQKVLMPKGAKILTIDVQGQNICMWALVDADEENREERHIRIHGTGHSVRDADKLEYISTSQMLGGNLIWHVFEVIQ